MPQFNNFNHYEQQMLIFNLATNKHGKCIKRFHWFPVHIHTGSSNLVYLPLNSQSSENTFCIAIISRQLTKNRNKIKFGFGMYEI